MECSQQFWFSLTNRTDQSIKLDHLSSSTLDTDRPQRCLWLQHHHFAKFADDTAVVGLIRGDGKTAYRYGVWHLGRMTNIIKDASHSNHGLFTLLPSGRRYRSLCSCASRLRKSFFTEAVTAKLHTTILIATLHTLLHRLQYFKEQTVQTEPPTVQL